MSKGLYRNNYIDEIQAERYHLKVYLLQSYIKPSKEVLMMLATEMFLQLKKRRLPRLRYLILQDAIKLLWEEFFGTEIGDFEHGESDTKVNSYTWDTRNVDIS